MRIARITLEGFKSYGQRVTIDGFHPGFNAITGPNGTGKSNTFDGILFAMGFRPGPQMRVNSLDELVFKRGQAGVTSAAVTIEFDNSDRATSPPMYVDQQTITVTRQIAIGGRDRHFVNGHVKKLKEVHRLFADARLSIEQPQFLVMQGRVTKVVTMKPLEILEFFQEAVGTSIFDKERRASERTLQDKQAQLAHIEHDVKHNFEPVLKHLRQEKENYTQWLKLGEYLPCVRYLWTCKKKNELEEEMEAVLAAITRGGDELVTFERRCVELGHRVQSLEEERRRTQVEMDELLKNQKLAKLDAELQPVNKAIAVAEDIIQDLQKCIAVKKKAAATKKNELEKMSKKVANFETQNEEPLRRTELAESRKNELQTELDSLATRIESVKNGDLCCDDGTNLVVAVREKEQQVRDLDMELLALKNKRELSEGVVRDLGPRIRSKGNIPQWKKAIASGEAQIAEVRKDLEEAQHDPEKHNELMRNVTDLAQRVKQLEGEINDVLRTQFSDTVLYRQRVQDPAAFPGQVLELFAVKESHQRFHIALEETGKGKLRHLVVKDDQTAQRIFAHAAELNRRVTCAPLDQLRSKPLNPGMVRKAKSLGRDPADVVDPMECIDVEDENLLPALYYAFSTAILCTHRETAEQMAEDPRWAVPAITINGERWESNGAMHGGSSSHLGRIIGAAMNLATLRRELREKSRRLDALKEELLASQRAATVYERRQEELERLQTHLNLTTEKLNHARQFTDEGRLLQATEELERIAERVSGIQACKKEIEAWLKPNRKAVESFSKDEELARLEKKRSKTAAALKQAEAILATTMKEAEAVRAQQAQLLTAKETLETEVQHIETEEIPAAEAEIGKKTAEVAANTEERARLEEQVEGEMAQRQEVDRRLMQLVDEREAAKAELTKNEHDIQVMQQRILTAKQQKGPTEKALAVACEKMETLPPVDANVMAEVTEKYKQATVADLKAEIDELSRQRGKLQMRIDKKAVESLSEAELKFQELSRDKLEAERSRDAVLKYIENIDQQKKQTLETSFAKVDSAFSQIFSTLLPGASARLVLLDPHNMNCGIEMAVSLQPRAAKATSLSALSGGQKSLLSLSLILAFLKLNPSPFYILDEVDAALDLSHTQNLGLMIKRYFPESQFIVVSHKDNLYSNADVLFSTAFVNGKSSVVRHLGTA